MSSLYLPPHEMTAIKAIDIREVERRVGQALDEGRPSALYELQLSGSGSHITAIRFLGSSSFATTALVAKFLLDGRQGRHRRGQCRFQLGRLADLDAGIAFERAATERGRSSKNCPNAPGASLASQAASSAVSSLNA